MHPHRRRVRPAAAGLLLLLTCAVDTPGPHAAQAWKDTGHSTDDEFIESLGSDASARPVDRRRLAKLFFGLASTLDGDKSSVRLQQTHVVVAESSRRAVTGLLESRYEQYTQTLASFRQSVSDLLDEPDSLLLFYRVFMEGQRACWQLDLHTLMIETYAGGADTLSVLSSREACARFRTVVFQPRVEGILRDALVEQIFQREEIRSLEGELRELEALLADLRDGEDTP